MQWKVSSGANPPYIDLMPSLEQKFNKENFEMAMKMLYDRQQITLNRFFNKSEYPWSENDILNNNKFLNVYRILDRNSQFEVSYITKDTSLKQKEYLWKTIFFRLFNQPELFSYLARFYKEMIPSTKEYNADDFHQHLLNYRKIGGNPFTNAYLSNSVACPGKTRDWCFAYNAIPKAIELLDEISKAYSTNISGKDFCKILTKIPCVADFLAHEMFVSLCFRNEVVKKKFRFNDWTPNDYANVGPGCSFGLSLIFPNKKTRKEQDKALLMLKTLGDLHFKKHYPDFEYIHFNIKSGKFEKSNKPNFTLLVYENSMCEFGKYWKMHHKVGKQRSAYKPRESKKEKFFLY